jgi:putative two-component system response regulator
MSNDKKIIILVDDNMANLTMGRTMLKEHYQVIPTPSAKKMFDILETVNADMILLDIDMPEMNGYEAIKLLKASERFASIPVIFLTSMDDENSEQKGLALGAADYVCKPFAAALLLESIKKHL